MIGSDQRQLFPLLQVARFQWQFILHQLSVTTVFSSELLLTVNWRERRATKFIVSPDFASVVALDKCLTLDILSCEIAPVALLADEVVQVFKIDGTRGVCETARQSWLLTLPLTCCLDSNCSDDSSVTFYAVVGHCIVFDRSWSVKSLFYES